MTCQANTHCNHFLFEFPSGLQSRPKLSNFTSTFHECVVKQLSSMAHFNDMIIFIHVVHLFLVCQCPQCKRKRYTLPDKLVQHEEKMNFWEANKHVLEGVFFVWTPSITWEKLYDLAFYKKRLMTVTTRLCAKTFKMIIECKWPSVDLLGNFMLWDVRTISYIFKTRVSSQNCLESQFLRVFWNLKKHLFIAF